MYEDIIIANKKAFGDNVVSDSTILQINNVNQFEVINEFYGFRSLISETELKSLIKLNEFAKGNIDF